MSIVGYVNINWDVESGLLMFYLLYYKYLSNHIILWEFTEKAFFFILQRSDGTISVIFILIGMTPYTLHNYT